MGLEERKAILKELRTPDRLRENLDVVDIVLGFLSSGGAKAEKPLGDYIDKVLKMKQRSFSVQVNAIAIILSSLPPIGEEKFKVLFIFRLENVFFDTLSLSGKLSL